MTLKKATKLVIAKWQIIYDNNLIHHNDDFFISVNFPKLWEELWHLLSNCAYCSLYYFNLTRHTCFNCPADNAEQNCLKEHSYYYKWLYAKTAKTRKKYALLILNFTKDFYKKHYKGSYKIKFR